MFCLSESDTFYLYPYPTDMRKSFYSLSGIVTNEMKRDVQEGRANRPSTAGYCRRRTSTCWGKN